MSRILFEQTSTMDILWDEEHAVAWAIPYVASIDGPQARDNVDALARLRDHHGFKKVRVVIDCRPLRRISRDARVVQSGSYTASVQRATALLTGDGVVARVIANFFMGLNKPISPTRLFEHENDAIAWLAEHPHE